MKSEENEEWWIIENDADMESLMESLQTILGHIEKWFDNFISKEETIHRILDKSAETFSDTMIISYPTAKLIAEMGYSMEVYELIKDTRITNPKAIKLIELADQLKSTIK